MVSFVKGNEMSNYIALDGVLSYFNVRFVQSLFEKYSGLEKESYSIYEKRFSDGSFSLCFQFPTDFTLMQAEELANKIMENITVRFNV